MEHTSNITKRDLAIGSYIIYINTKINLIFLLGFAIIGNAFTFELNDVFLDYHSLLIFLFTILLHFIILLIISFPIIAVYALFTPMVKKGILGKHFFEFTDNGFLEKTDYNETLHKYTLVNKVFTYKKTIYIILSGGHGHILPKRDFQTEKERISLLKFLYDKSQEYGFTFKSDILFNAK
jgi:hypothetical protein